jgi:beta-fructofuranosidase
MGGVDLRVTRRGFLGGVGAVAALAAGPRRGLGQEGEGAGGEVAEAKLAVDPMRPQFHLLPAHNWMNDPNGPIYFRGKYHMFFQYNPQGAVWGNMSWNHAVSGDMLHWTHLPLAMTETVGGPDAAGVFSGSAIAVEMPGRKSKRVYAVYTGIVKSTPEMETIRNEGTRESQCLAWSDDPLLERWTKDPVPVVARPPEGLKITGFRDPSVWRQGEWYYMTVGSGIDGVGGCVLLYRSPVKAAEGETLKKWEYMHPLTQGEWNGKRTSNPCDDGEMWECPEFFALGGAGGGAKREATHVLIYSTLGKVWWESGVLDAGTMKFVSKKKGLLDLDAFYAPKTQLDAVGRRILWGWIPERRTEAAMKAAGWSGMMSLPRVMELDADGTLRLTVLPEVKALRSGRVGQEESRAGVLRTLRGASGEVMCVGAGGDFTFTMSDDAGELVKVGYSAERHVMTADGEEVQLEVGDAATVHGFVDGSVIELILGERIGYTKRFYYDGAAPDVRALVVGDAGMEAWTIAAISDDRLTTPARGL